MTEVAPADGPRLLFFSGGSALRDVSRALKRATHNSIHLLTPFDSGGSSAVLRRAFGMMSVGDLRSRLIALADETTQGHPAVSRLFSHRLPTEAAGEELHAQVRALAAGTDPLMAAVPEPLQGAARAHLEAFRAAAPAGFDHRGASVGNLVLTGAWLQEGRHMGAALERVSALAAVRGTVRPTASANLHLRAALEDGTVLDGQHLITGKTAPPIRSPIRRLSLIRSLEEPAPAEAHADEAALEDLRRADLLVFPMGSFYTSVLANLLPAGVAEALVESPAPKVYLPNVGEDPEMLGMKLSDATAALLSLVRARVPGAPAARALDAVLIDPRRDRYALELDAAAVQAMGVAVVEAPLLDEAGAHHDPRLVVQALLSLAERRQAPPALASRG